MSPHSTSGAPGAWCWSAQDPVLRQPTENLLLPPLLRQDANLQANWKPHLWYPSFPWDPGYNTQANYVQRAKGEASGMCISNGSKRKCGCTNKK